MMRSFLAEVKLAADRLLEIQFLSVHHSLCLPFGLQDTIALPLSINGKVRLGVMASLRCQPCFWAAAWFAYLYATT